jgi:trimeric autotransporter adhesin
MVTSRITRIAAASLLGSVSLFGLATSAQASRVLFSTDPALANHELTDGSAVSTDHGTTQIALDDGAIASFVDEAHFSVRTDGSIDLQSGTVTIVSPSGSIVDIHMPDGVNGSVTGKGGSASFTANATGTHGNVISGGATIASINAIKQFKSGSFWAAGSGNAPALVVANAPIAAPEAALVQSVREGGIAAAAQNGVPVSLGEGLAAIGATGDILAAARRVEAYDHNPTLASFPQGDYVLLTAYAAQAASPYGSAAFRGAGADIVRTYFQFLATGGSASAFQSNYARVLVSYLDLLRAGALPSSFAGATQDQLNAYIAYIGRTDGFGSLSAANKSLLDAYLTFLQGGGSANGFGTNATSLVSNYLNFVRGGGDPAAFAQASQSVVAQYLAILQSGGLHAQLTPQNQALLSAYLGNGSSLAFANSQATAIAAFNAYLNTGGLPSQYTALDVATLKTYLQTLSDTGLFDRLLGSQASFLRTYLTYLQGGGSVDQFSQLPINVLTGQAAAMNTYYTFIQNGGTPSLYPDLTQPQILAYLTALQNAGLFNRLLGSSSSFFGDYFAYLNTGSNPDIYAGLPNVDLNAYAMQVQSFVTFLRAGNLPSGYTALTADQIRAYINALSASGRLASLTGGDATFLSAYLTYLQGGGAPNAYSGLPIVAYQSYATALNLYYTFLAGGGNPSAYTALTATQIQDYLAALQTNGQLASLLGANASFFTSYLTYVQGGGVPSTYSGLPIVTYRSYATALNLYYTFLAGGGRPSAYTVLTAAQIQAYLAALQSNGQIAALLGTNATFFSNYYTYIVGGGVPDTYASLPATGGGGTGGGTTPPVVTANAPTTGRMAFIANNFDYLRIYSGSVSSTTSGTVASVIDLADPTNPGRGRGNAREFDSGGVGGVLGWTRWEGDQITSVSGAIIYGLPTLQLPTTGSISYNLVGSTTPVATDNTFARYLGSSGTVAPTSPYTGGIVRSAQLAINFASRAVNLNSVIGIGGKEFTLSGSGGLGSNVGGLSSYNSASSFRLSLSANSGSFTTSGVATGFVAGTAADYAGVSYAFLPEANSSVAIAGVLAFSKSTAPNPLPTPTAAAPNGSGLNFATFAGLSGSINNSGSFVAQADGRLSQYQAIGRGTATDHENGGIASVIGWTRWSGGTDSAGAVLPENGGRSIIWAAPATAVPTSGTANYTVSGGTAVTESTGSLAPGSVTAAHLTVNFATNQLGYDVTFGINSKQFSFESTGGVAAPSISISAGNGYIFNDFHLGPGGSQASVNGFLAGAGASHAGIAFGYYGGAQTNGLQVNGVIAFTKGP